MSRKEATAVTALLFGTFITGAFAETISPTSPNRTIVRTTSTDIEVLKLVPGVGSSLGTVVSADSRNPQSHFNFTSSFSFAPANGFVQVNLVLLTVTFTESQPVLGASFNVQLNGHLANTVQMPQFGSTPATATGAILASDLRVGANIVSVGLDLPSNNVMIVCLYEVRLTVEYTFQG